MAELDKYGLSLPARKGEKKESVNAVVVLSKLWYVGLEVTTPNLSLDKDLWPGITTKFGESVFTDNCHMASCLLWAINMA